MADEMAALEKKIAGGLTKHAALNEMGGMGALKGPGPKRKHSGKKAVGKKGVKMPKVGKVGKGKTGLPKLPKI